MSDYVWIVNVLRDFDLITEAQFEKAISDYEKERVAYGERMDTFKREWEATHGWWRRTFGRWWLADFWAEEDAR